LPETANAPTGNAKSMTSEEMEPNKSFRHAVRGDFLLVLISGILFTAFALQWSFQNGRLTRDPSFDDVVYFVDGLERVRVLYDHGFEGLVRDLWKDPPHSPWSTGLAFLSFLLLGAHDWVPYLANGIIVVLFLALSLLVADARDPLLKVLIICFVCSFPWALRAVQDFRPDFAVALFTSGGILFAIPRLRLASVQTRETKRWLLASGLCFAMAFVTKPSFVLHTLLLYTYSLGIVVTCNFRWRDKSPLGHRLAQSLKPLPMLLVPVVCVALPYYALAWQEIGDYIWRHSRGESAHLWRLPTGYLGTIAYYFIGPPAQEMMKAHLIIVACLIMLGFASAVAREEYYKCWYGLLVLGASALSLLTFGISRIGNPFFGLTSQVLESLLAIHFVGSNWNVPEKWLRLPLRVIAVIAILAGIIGMLPNPAADRPQQTPVNAVERSVNREVVETVHAYAQRNDLRGTEGLRVLVTFAGDINDVAMKWIALKRGLRYQFSGNFFSESIEPYINASESAAFLVSADRDATGVAPWIPSNKIADQILKWIRAQADWSLLQTIEAYDGLNYFVFVNPKNVRAFRNSVSLGPETHGFLAIEGPYPDGLGVVRWGIAPESTTLFNLPGGEKRVLVLSARSIPGQTLTILLNDSEQLRHTFKTGEFEEITVPLFLAKGENRLTLRYTMHLPVTADKIKRAVLFREISLLPP
jgi:hypothetical protein